jgi:hypothetical protein
MRATCSKTRPRRTSPAERMKMIADLRSRQIWLFQHRANSVAAEN